MSRLQGLPTKIFSAILAVGIFAVTFTVPIQAASVNSIGLLKQDAEGEQMYIRFQYKMYFNDVDRERLFDFMRQIQNDDLWCNCSETEVTFEGYGRKNIFRKWEQTYQFAGITDQITYTRLGIREDERHTWKGEGQFADILGSYKYDDLDNGGTLLTFDAIYKPNVPATEQQISGILEALRASYENDFITYFDSTGTVDLTKTNFFYI